MISNIRTFAIKANSERRIGQQDKLSFQNGNHTQDNNRTHSNLSSYPPLSQSPLLYTIYQSLNGLESTDYEIAPLWKYVKEADECFKKAKIEKKKRKASTLYHLTKYLVQGQNKNKWIVYFFE